MGATPSSSSGVAKPWSPPALSCPFSLSVFLNPSRASLPSRGMFSLTFFVLLTRIRFSTGKTSYFLGIDSCLLFLYWKKNFCMAFLTLTALNRPLSRNLNRQCCCSRFPVFLARPLWGSEGRRYERYQLLPSSSICMAGELEPITHFTKS